MNRTTRNIIYCLIGLFFIYNLEAQQTKSQDEISSTNYIVVDGSKLNYVIEGKGTPCLVIGSSVYYPKTFSKKLREHLKMYFVDLKWFAKDYLPENLDSVNIQSIVEDVEEIRKKLGLVKPIIMGHSIHGTISMEYVKKYSNEVSSLIIIGSPSHWGNEIYAQKAAALWETASEKRKEIQKQNWGDFTEVDRLTGEKETIAQYVSAAPQYWYDPYYDANWLWDGMTVHTELTTHLFSKVFSNYDMFKDIPKISNPVFVGMGKYDYVIPYTLWKAKYKAIPDFTLFIFEKSGHTPQLEESQLFDDVLIEWLDSK